MIDRTVRLRLFGWACSYLLFFGLASLADLWSTQVALQRPGTFEGNVFATSANGSLDMPKTLLISLIGGIALLAMFVIALLRANAVSDHYMLYPARALVTMKGTLNPFARTMIERMPIQFMAFALAFPLLRFLAAGNNLMLAAGYGGPLSFIVNRTTELTNPIIGFLILMPLFFVMVLGIAPVAARLLRVFRGDAQTS